MSACARRRPVRRSEFSIRLFYESRIRIDLGILPMNIDTNLAELPWQVASKLCENLNLDAQWRKIAEVFRPRLNFRPEDIAVLQMHTNPTEQLLRQLGNRLFTVGDFLVVLDRLKLEVPQLILKRKFKPIGVVEMTPYSGPVVSHDFVDIRCLANGFPYPHYQWYCNDEAVLNGNRSEIILDAKTSSSGFYKCHVWNEIGADESWTSFYRKTGKMWKSEKTSDVIEVTLLPTVDAPISGPSCSDSVDTNLLKKLSLLLNESEKEVHPSTSNDQAAEIGEDDCIATDKVALIVCNSEYEHLPKLHTPACDAETLAERLLSLGFKTVTLTDLTLTEMKHIMEEYKRLLGKGVYAAFYFVGHGFETRGQCYLLPIDAPDVNYKCRDCLCAEEMLVQMQETEPALNLILLDICRRFPPHDAALISDEVVQFKPRVNRNTIFGYATSLGEGAYEVKGEMNGIFMKHFKEVVVEPIPLTEVLHRVMRALENDAKAAEVQFPEIRTNLSRPRSLTDPLVFAGHTTTFDFRTLKWQEIHALPDPVKVHFDKYNLMVTVWFDFCGHFTNMIYVFTSVCSVEEGAEPEQNESSMDHLGYLTFPEYLDSSQTSVCEDSEEGVSVRTLLRHLQRLNGPLVCELRLHNRRLKKTVAIEPKVDLGELLISKLPVLG